MYQLYSKSMFNTALRITGDEMGAEDVLQEGFLSAFKNLDSYRGEASFGSWLKRIIVNKALSQVQKSKRDWMLAEEYGIVDEAEMYEQAEPAYSVEQIKHAMGQLSTGFRTVLSLYLFEGYDHKEISSILGISESTSKTQYKRAKDKLKSIIKEEVNYG